MNGGLTCMNCGKPTSNEEGKLFAEVFVCGTCFLLAERLYKKLEDELRGLLFILKDRIREYLVQGKFHYGEDTPLQALSKKDLVQAIQFMKENRNGRSTAGEVQAEVPGGGLPGGETR